MAIPDTIGVLGAGTMGAGIAQLAAQAGAHTLLYDPVPEARGRAIDGIASALERQVEKGRMDAGTASAVRERIEPVEDVASLAPSGLVVEAAPERLELKRELLGALAEVVDSTCVIATNTSSLSVTEIATTVPEPGRVVGLHFFNPAPVMRLVELVPGVESSPAALATARAVGEAMGKRVIDAADVAGFVVNRVNRPFFLESLRLLQEGIASVEQIDRVLRLGGGFRMGPFELMDLIGIDTNHAVAEGFLRQSYGEPRYRPSPLQARMVTAGRLGRKTGRGWYEYVEGADHREPDPDPPPAGGGGGRLVVIAGTAPIAAELLAAASDAGWDARPAGGADEAEPWLAVDCGDDGASASARGPHTLVLCRGSLHSLCPTAVGFHALPPFEACRLVELTRTPRTDPVAADRAGAFVSSLGRHVEWVEDAPGLVLGRVVSQLVNEAAFLLGEGNGSADDIDAGLELGVNHPRGPVAWSDAIGLPHVISVLDALRGELGEERYRAAPLLRRRVAIAAGLR